MKVFLNWSGRTSQAAAVAIGEWLSKVSSSVEVVYPDRRSIEETRWSEDQESGFRDIAVALFIVTPENIRKYWIVHESLINSQRLFRRQATNNVFLFLFGVKSSDLEWPIDRYPYAQYDKGEMWSLLQLITRFQGIAEEELARSFGRGWNNLENKLDPLFRELHLEAQLAPPSKYARFDAMMEELIVLSRRQNSMLEGDGIPELIEGRSVYLTTSQVFLRESVRLWESVANSLLSTIDESFSKKYVIHEESLIQFLKQLDSLWSSVVNIDYSPSLRAKTALIIDALGGMNYDEITMIHEEMMCNALLAVERRRAQTCPEEVNWLEEIPVGEEEPPY